MALRYSIATHAPERVSMQPERQERQISYSLGSDVFSWTWDTLAETENGRSGILLKICIDERLHDELWCRSYVP